ncbi:GIY-YIG nuclease family protein [Hyphococcus sp. DH-69]|uniref:GIY-YIG nuclease family protein n=1 Tax=Hyphococcus formosus TaxID=3143534 RepID=UPI00398A9D9E
MKPFFVYILASKRNGTLYTGSTDDLGRRVWEHKEKIRKGFTAKYDVGRLVWYETHDTREAALLREKQIKKWNRSWKLRMIEAINPDWDDLYLSLNG